MFVSILFLMVFAFCLQTIKNDDLEEIRELGSGTYGAVYQGKWKGSVVAIKRIKASCFAARPAERERMVITISTSLCEALVAYPYNTSLLDDQKG